MALRYPMMLATSTFDNMDDHEIVMAVMEGTWSIVSQHALSETLAAGASSTTRNM
jgi:hypothetical protein